MGLELDLFVLVSDMEMNSVHFYHSLTPKTAYDPDTFSFPIILTLTTRVDDR